MKPRPNPFFLWPMAVSLLASACSPSGNGQATSPAAASPGQPAAIAQGTPPQPGSPPQSGNPLDTLLGPIALYPDPLIAIILPASTFPDDIAAASSALGAGGDPASFDSQPWDPSVHALAHYPEVLNWMAQNAQWTQALGAAFASSPADVMASIQRLRAEARAVGSLTDSPQQQVVVDNGAIDIEPAQPDAIYVPYYDPGLVYYQSGYSGTYLTYGPAWPVGAWLSFGFDWNRRVFWQGDWSQWHGQNGWRHPSFTAAGNGKNATAEWRRSASRPAPRAPAGWQARPPTAGRPSAAQNQSSPQPRSQAAPSRDFRAAPAERVQPPRDSVPRPSTPAPNVERSPEFARPSEAARPPAERRPEAAPEGARREPELERPAPRPEPAPRPAPPPQAKAPPQEERQDRDKDQPR